MVATRLTGPALGFLFFLSGAAALIYQVVWQRILSLGAGVGVRSMSIVVGAFMLGLGLGSEMGGRLANRLSPQAALKAFAVIEALLCVVGGASPFLFYDGLYLNLSTWMSDLGRVAVVQALLPPTLLMGASLPLLVRATVTASQDAPRLWAAWSGNIYSVEFFDLCRRRLAPGGLFVTWAPTDRIKRSVAEAFPYTRAFLSDFLVGSNQPIPTALAQEAMGPLGARLGSKAVEDLDRLTRESREVAKSAGELNRDLHPRDEFAGPGGD